ncbi:MAG: hypothetical protein ACR2FU_14195 [Streptosporangiaceae bacterium]
MDTRALPEMAGDVLVAALRGERSADVFAEVRALFLSWQLDPPDDLYQETIRLAGPLAPGEERALAGRWKRLCRDLLGARPGAEPDLRALIERAMQGFPPQGFPPQASPPPVSPPPASPPSASPPAAPAPSSPAGPGASGRRGPGWTWIGSLPPGQPPAAPGPGRSGPGGGRPASARKGCRGGLADKTKQSAEAVRPDDRDPVRRAIRSAVRPGVLAFNPPEEMTQGRPERVEVGVARSAELVDGLVSGLRGRGGVRIEPVPTSAFMSAELRGDSFVIAALSPAEQIVAPTARWEFDVTPRRAGVQTLTLCIRVSVGYGARSFFAQNWQWLVGTAIALGGAVAAILALVH